MGTQPENIERALQGRRTLPRPGERPEPVQGAGEEGGETPKKTTNEPVEQRGADPSEQRKGPHGQLHTEDEEHRFQARGGRFNRASPEGEDRV